MRLTKEERKFKDNSRRTTNEAVRKGIIKKQPCKICGSLLSEKHHPDYSKPLLIMWLCRKHHFETHFPLEKRGVCGIAFWINEEEWKRTEILMKMGKTQKEIFRLGLKELTCKYKKK